MSISIGVNGAIGRANGTGALSTGALGSSNSGSSFVVVCGTQANTPNTPTDTYSNTWTQLFSQTDTNNNVHWLCWTAFNGTGGANHAFQCTGFAGGNRAAIIAIEIIPDTLDVLALDGSPGFLASLYTSTTTYNASVTSVIGGVALAFGLAGQGSATDTITINGGYTSLPNTIITTSGDLCVAAGWRLTSATTAYNPATTDSTTGGAGFVSANVLFAETLPVSVVVAWIT